jgi:hypothetical protein
MCEVDELAHGCAKYLNSHTYFAVPVNCNLKTGQVVTSDSVCVENIFRNICARKSV